MAKHLIKNLDEEGIIQLFRCTRTGIAWVENGKVGIGHSAHPNIDGTGSIRGMKKQGYWRQDARTERTHGYIYNIDRLVISDEYDQVAADHCNCAACRERRGGRV